MSAIERAALVIAKDDPAFEDGTYGFEDYLAMARAAFEVIDVDELAEALRQATDAGADRTEDYARAVVAHLTKGDESNE